ncbi:cytochrome c oxidase assembly protein [Dactylosporangium sp. NPDC000521]|uniref:cytochrome c oxidase assembly protein n=1 Tax=Dactylosporangium sp. NPDC000521 TaxID=3363975 RepID=UPI0036A238FA
MHDPHPEVVGLLLLAGLCGYPAALLLPRRRRPWPVWRTLSWSAGLLLAAAAALYGGHHGFTAHAACHVVLGMIAPLLLCLSAPVTLLLRALPPRPARGLSRALRSTPVRLLTHPTTALLLDAGGLWLLYATPLHTRIGDHPLVHAHVFLAGCLLTWSLVGRDPAPHRAAWSTRAAVLVAFIAAHGMLAKYLYAHDPAAATGAQLMYYAGDAVDVTLLVLLFRAADRRTCRLRLLTGATRGGSSAPAAVVDPGARAPR